MKPVVASLIITLLIAPATVAGPDDRDPEPTPVEVENFPDTQEVTGTVQVGNLPAVQRVAGVVGVGNFPLDDARRLAVSDAPIVNHVVDLLETRVYLDWDGTRSWESDIFDTSRFNVFGLKAEKTPGGSGAECDVTWQWSDDDRFAGPGVGSPAVAPGGPAKFTDVYGLRARVRCWISASGSRATLTGVKVLLRRD